MLFSHVLVILGPKLCASSPQTTKFAVQNLTTRKYRVQQGFMSFLGAHMSYMGQEHPKYWKVATFFNVYFLESSETQNANSCFTFFDLPT